ncbi:MAG: hypothetical protein INQ03_16175 [Candidatus Heimdallarchaeota archaeon]|nr:hypothetical protein [Candidatus Heimdallarchaeota archaeon]
MSKEVVSQVFCAACNQTLTVRIDMVDFLNNNPEVKNGLIKKSLVHSDHVLLCDIDGHGNVRGMQIVEILKNPIERLAQDIGMAFYFVNTKAKRPLHLDIYTSNRLLKKFTNLIITEMFNISNGEHKIAGSRMIISTYKNSTTLSADRLTLSLGPFILQGTELLDNPHKGLFIESNEFAKSGKSLEDLLILYDWVVFLNIGTAVSEDKVKHICESYNIEYFYGKLDNQNITEAFDFISQMAMDKY